MLTPWVPPFGAVFPLSALLLSFGVFVGLALAIAAFLGTLRVRNGRPRWLGVRHTLAAAAAVGLTALALLISAILLNLTAGLREIPRLQETPAFGAVVALSSLLAGWLALQLQRWAEPLGFFVRSRPSRWNPRFWGTVGVVGLTMSLAATLTLTWTVIRFSELPSMGPTSLMAATAAFAMSVVAASGLVLIAAEVTSGRTPRLLARQMP